MKTKSLLSIVAVAAAILTSCQKEEPAENVAGVYTGSFEGTYLGHDTLTSDGYQVDVKYVNDNKVTISGFDFDDFDVLVTPNGLNVEAVNKSDENLVEFLYIGDEKKLKFKYIKDGNEARFIGIK